MKTIAARNGVNKIGTPKKENGIAIARDIVIIKCFPIPYEANS